MFEEVKQLIAEYENGLYSDEEFAAKLLLISSAFLQGVRS